MKPIKNKLRVVHFPQIGSCRECFTVEVKDEEQAAFTIKTLALQHLWLEKHQIIPDYANAIFVEMYDESIDEETNKPYGWSDYYNEEEHMDWNEIEFNYFK